MQNPKTFNKVYRVSRVTPTELFIDNNWAPISGGSVFYETRKGTLSGADPYIDPNGGSASDALIDNNNATNVITVSDEGRLVDKLVTYSANAQPVPPQFVSVKENTKIVIDSAALPSVNFDGTFPAVDITVVRQRLRIDDKYPIVTTLDHDVVNVNGSLIKLDNYNNPSSIADSINRQIDLRKQFIREPRNPQLNEGLKLGFVMTKDPFVPVMGNMSSRSISNYGPFIRDKDVIEKLSGGELSADNELVLVSGAEKPLNESFNKGEIFVGPVRGLEYTDIDTGIQYIWNADMNQYIPLRNVNGEVGFTHDPIEKPKPPENHVDSSEVLAEIAPWIISTQDSGEVVYGVNSLVRWYGRVYEAVVDVYYNDNTAFVPVQANGRVVWQDVTRGRENAKSGFTLWAHTALATANTLIPTVIPGTGTGTNKTPGVKQAEYNLDTEVTYTTQSGLDVSLYQYALGISAYNLFEVYQFVQNANNDIYYIKVDEVNPQNLGAPIDYYNTVSQNAVPTEVHMSDFYFINQRVPTVATVQVTNEAGQTVDVVQITDFDDPVLRKNTSSAVTLGAVEPAMYVGKQLIPEPYAVRGGNGSDAIANILSIPGLKVDGSDVTVTADGNNRYFMWTPGLTPQKWIPQKDGPGPLPGVNGNSAIFGFGRGYYQENDDHLADYYPPVATSVVEGHSGWDRTMPRFLYSKKFTVVPEVNVSTQDLFVSLIDGATLTFDEAEALGFDNVELVTVNADFADPDDESPDNTKLRPEEIFVACFWTEAFTYTNQWIDIDYNANPPVPIAGDYDGTVARVKYIRLTELPPNAMTRRPIPDTGWSFGLKQWNNRPVDLETLPLTDQTIAEIFTPTSNANGGSTGDDLDGSTVTLALTGSETSDTLNPNNTAYVDEAGNLLLETALNRETIPVTNKGPIINGDVFSGLPGPCVTLANPAKPDLDMGGDCTAKEEETKFVYATNKDMNRRGGTIAYEDSEEVTRYFHDYGRFDPAPWNRFEYGSSFPEEYVDHHNHTDFPWNYDNAKWGFINIRIAGKNNMRVYFDNLKNTDADWLGVTIVQSDRPYFALRDGELLDRFGMYGDGDDPSTTDTDETFSIANIPYTDVNDVDQTDGVASESPSNTYTQEYWSNSATRILKSTEVSGTVAGRQGDQILQYGVDMMADNQAFRGEVDVFHAYRNDDGTYWNAGDFVKLHQGQSTKTDYSDGKTTDFSVNNSRGAFSLNSYDADGLSGTEDYGTATETRVLSNHIWNRPLYWDQPIDSMLVGDVGATTPANSEEWFAKQFNVDIGVRGIGVLETVADCAKGDFITVFYRVPDSVTREDFENEELFRTTVEWIGERVADPDIEVIEPPPGETECDTSDGSYGWSQGAVKTTLRANGSNGYFGSLDRDGETWDRSVSLNRSLKRITGTIRPSRQNNCKLDNIYYPYQSLPNWYASHSDNTTPLSNTHASNDFKRWRNLDTGAWVTQSNKGWGQWSHNNYRFHGSSGVTKYTSTAISFTGRVTIPRYHTFEYKGYFRAPYTGVYDFQAYSDDGIWVWVSSEPTTTLEFGTSGRMVRSGVNDKGLNTEGQDAGGEYFKDDGYNPNNQFSYHRQNACNSNGWLTSDDNVKRLLPAERLVKLNEGDFYFVRIICGNNDGPGYAECKWFVQTDEPVENYHYYNEDLWHSEFMYQHTGIGTAQRQTTARSGYINFGGKVCIDDAPPGTVTEPPPGPPGGTTPPPGSSTPPPSGTTTPPPGSSTPPPSSSTAPPPGTTGFTYSVAPGTSINTSSEIRINITAGGDYASGPTDVVMQWKDFDDLSFGAIQEDYRPTYNLTVYENKVIWRNWPWDSSKPI